MKRMMIDIETLGTEESAMIVSIGAVVFDLSRIYDEFYAVCDIEISQPRRTIDPSTVTWWMKQSEEAKAVFSVETRQLHIQLKALQHFLDLSGAEEVWANSPDFDLRILKHAFEQNFLPWPVKFYQERDVRTAKAMLNEVPEKFGVQHNALGDCLYQVKIVQEALRAAGKES